MKKLLFSVLSIAAAMSLNATVFATVDGKEITEVELAPHLAAFGANANNLNDDQKKAVLSRAIDVEILAAEARKAGVAGDKEYKDALKTAQDRLAIQAYERRLAKNIKVSDAEITNFYNQNKARFTEPARQRASNITVKTQTEANAIIKELKGLNGSALTQKFAEVAAVKSIVPDAKQTGGRLAWFSQEQMPKEFWNGVSKLKNGTVSATPIKTQMGYHVVLKEGSAPQKTLTKDEAKPFIESVIKQQKAAAEAAKKLIELRQKVKVEVK